MGGSGSYAIGPGIWAFLAFFVMAIGLWLLVRNMSGRLRRMAYEERDGMTLGQDGAGKHEGAAGSMSRVTTREPGATDASIAPDDLPPTDGPTDPDAGENSNEGDDPDEPDDPTAGRRG